MAWNAEQVLALAPDVSSVKSGKDLSAPRKWKTLGASETCVWGTIQGSGKDPYQTCIDLGGPAFKCTCPSRKFPCKHGLGLFLIFAQQSASMTEKQTPAWAAEWLAKRVEKEEKKTVRQAEPSAADDPEAAAKAAAAAQKRVAARETKITDGLNDLGTWLEDLVRTGFASLPGKPASFWETPAARLVDAQAPGLARRVQSLDGITTTGQQWPEQLLRELASLHLAREGWARIDTLPPGTQADLRAAIGFTTSQEELLAQSGLRDEWLVAGHRIEEDDRLRVQRTWLFGSRSKRPALCLSFSAGPNQPLDLSLVPGTVVDAELVFFPSSWPLRALVKQRHGSPARRDLALPHKTIAEANAFAAEAFMANPWLERVPMAFHAVTPQHRDWGWIISDKAGHYLRLDIQEMKAWKLFSLSGGSPVSLAGEWDGEALHPVGVWAEGRYLLL